MEKKWVYVEYKDGTLLWKGYEKPKVVFDKFKEIYAVISTIINNNRQVVYKCWW